MKDNFKKQLWISFGVIFASVIAATAGLYFFSGDLSQQTNKVIIDKGIVESRTDALASLADLKQSAPDAARYKAAIEKLLPDQYGLIGFGPWLGQLGKKYGVTASFVLQGESSLSQGNAPGNIGFSLDASGPPNSMAPFLKDFESQTAGFLLTLNSFDFTNDGTKERVVAQGTLFFK